ncbi:hypothetical protein EVAR_73841_1 [Eumeta japonica]|uniref:HTH psq-type domain-containing protein n=1 Tax=Eumeta variegata TaxID=151549 RepID=A0A4C1SIS4_EUMVA|nr:hypothetical protein EVAR_73841_1 [Eumeta japonica]
MVLVVSFSLSSGVGQGATAEHAYVFIDVRSKQFDDNFICMYVCLLRPSHVHLRSHACSTAADRCIDKGERVRGYDQSVDCTMRPWPESRNRQPQPGRESNLGRRQFEEPEEETDDQRHGQHGRRDIKPEGVQWCASGGCANAGCEEPGTSSDSDEWADAPADIGSFLHTKLKVDGDNSGDEDSIDVPSMPGVPLGAPVPVAMPPCPAEPKLELTVKPLSIPLQPKHVHKRPDLPYDFLGLSLGPRRFEGPPAKSKAAASSKTTTTTSSSTDPRFTDVIKLNEYLLHGRRPQFWEEDYVKRVMEAVRLKELEMKQAAEILGVSYGTLYGRYRDVYGCINRPYSIGFGHRSARDFWAAKGPSDIIERLQRGDVTIEVAAQALGVSPANLAAYISDLPHMPAAATIHHEEKEFEPIPIEIDPSLKMKGAGGSGAGGGGGGNNPCSIRSMRKNVAAAEKAVKRILIGNLDEDEPIPATVIRITSALLASARNETFDGSEVMGGEISCVLGLIVPVTGGIDIYTIMLRARAHIFVYYGAGYHPGEAGKSVLHNNIVVSPVLLSAGGKWPAIRVANIDSLRGTGSGSGAGPDSAGTATSPTVEVSPVFNFCLVIRFPVPLYPDEEPTGPDDSRGQAAGQEGAGERHVMAEGLMLNRQGRRHE